MTSIDTFRAALIGREVRVEFSPTINFTQGTTVETARLYTKNANGRWVKVDPLLLPQEDGGRAELLDDLATIARGQ